MDVAPAVDQTRSRPDRRELRVALFVALAVAAFGAPYGLLWSALAPDIPVIKVDGGVVPADPAPEQMIAGDAWFALLGLCFGVLAAIVTWLVARRRRGPAVLVALAVGAAVGGSIAGWLGQRIGLVGYERALAAATPGTALTHPPDLRVAEFVWWFVPKAPGVLWVEAFAATVTYTLLAGWSRYRSLRPEQPTGQTGAVSWGSSVPRDPPAAPAPPAPGEAASPRD